MAKLTPTQMRALEETAAVSPAFYWPNGPICASLRALQRRGLVDYWLGRGWKLTPTGEAARTGTVVVRPAGRRG